MAIFNFYLFNLIKNSKNIQLQKGCKLNYVSYVSAVIVTLKAVWSFLVHETS